MSIVKNNFILCYSSLLIIIFTLSTSTFPEEITPNTAPLETNILPINLEQTIERLKQLNQSVLFKLHPSFTESPSLGFNTFIQKNEKLTYSETSEPLIKEQLIASKHINITPKFEDIFFLLSDETRLKACKKIYSNTPQDFVQKIVHYLGKGSPEQAMVINQILPYLQNELEEHLIALLQKNPTDIVKKRSIIYALGQIKSEKSAPLLWNEIQTTQSEEIQYTCVQALANMPHSLSLEQWLQLLQYNSVPISLTSAYAIVEYGGSSSEEYIRRILFGEFPVSQRVLEYLTDRISNHPLHIFIPFSIEVMKRNPSLSQKFSSLLSKKTGVNFGPNPQLWENWWKEYLNSVSSIETPENIQPSPDRNPPQPDVKIHQPRVRKR